VKRQSFTLDSVSQPSAVNRCFGVSKVLPELVWVDRLTAAYLIRPIEILRLRALGYASRLATEFQRTHLLSSPYGYRQFARGVLFFPR